MKVVVVHNAYGSASPSGENTAFAAECQMLSRAGHDVVPFMRCNDELYARRGGSLKASFTACWNFAASRRLQQVVRSCKPDVVHVHNTFPLFSPAVFAGLRGESAAVVHTLHNYRAGCAAGTLSRDGGECRECVDTASVLPALKHGCYRGSRLATLPVAAMIALHRRLRTLQDGVDQFVCLTEYQRRVLLSCGLPGDRITLKPNMAPAPVSRVPWSARARKAVFIGRLAEYKGVGVLARAWRLLGADAPELEIIGDGPERRTLERDMGALPGVRFTGQLMQSAVEERLSSAQLLILPSLCPEGLPMVLRESMGCGVPVAASQLGGMAEAVRDGQTGWLFEPGCPEQLARAVREAFANAGQEAERRGEAAYRHFLEYYSEAANLATLLAIYQQAIARRARHI